MRASTARVMMKLDLRDAVEAQALSLRFQPQIDLATRRVTSLEALVRWHHPVWGQVPPSVFIPMAEKIGLIEPIFQFVLPAACKEAMQWPEDVNIAVNISATQFQNKALTAFVEASLRKTGLRPSRLELEITESAEMRDDPATHTNFHALRESGIRIAIDDFGVGFSTLGCLMKFPFDKMKIDRSFITQLVHAQDGGGRSRSVLRSMIRLGERLGITCTAEGVETPEQLSLLMSERCDEAQGYLFSRPVAEPDLAFMQKRIHMVLGTVDQDRGQRPEAVAFFQVAQLANDIIMVTTPDLDAPGPRIVYVNAAFTRLTGYTAAEAIGASPRMLQGPGTSRAALDAIRAGLQEGRDVHEKLLNYNKSGAPYWVDLRIMPLRDENGAITHFAAIERDVTMDRRRQHELALVADRDTLTGIPNRRALLRALEAEIEAEKLDAGAALSTGGPCVILIDVDHVTLVNERHGKAVGDALLCGIADRLASNIRRSDMVGRIGGEAFAVCVSGARLREVKRLAESLNRAIAAAPFETPVGPLKVTVSVGAASYTPGDTLADLLARADAAMSDAKRAGRNRTKARMAESGED